MFSGLALVPLCSNFQYWHKLSCGILPNPCYGIVQFFVGWLKQIIKMKQDKEYKVVMHKFIGYSETGSATYEITFNKSLEHTGRFSGIENGLNAYCKKERRADITDNFKRLWYSLVRWVKN